MSRSPAPAGTTTGGRFSGYGASQAELGIVRTRLADTGVPTGLGWWGVSAGIGLGLAPFVRAVEAAWLVPYAAFGPWLLTTCVVLPRRTTSAGR